MTSSPRSRLVKSPVSHEWANFALIELGAFGRCPWPRSLYAITLLPSNGRVADVCLSLGRAAALLGMT
ncbi:hypothetical protein chiPu_0016570 [Chiloscyllium punctatum]|uniref:Uncharacterized protein n=1 Tax=Chiloscyllium punctatum TaxID=137246 RepID=A0A401T5Y5_CHIPU|nr:hypothetical protein [Chiloscyllium punctatum]